MDIEMVKYRIAELELLAEEDGIEVSEESKENLMKFLEGNSSFAKRPYISLLDNGNFRALWVKNDEQVGLQFTNGVAIHYVMWNKKDKFYGFDVEGEVMTMISENNLIHVMED